MLLILLSLAAIPPVILSLCFAVEVLAGLWPLPTRSASSKHALAAAVIIIPAHDEEASIAATIAALGIEAAGIADLLVVADNCTDRTAEIARASGAKTIVRDDPGARGKGHALAFGRSELAKDPPAVVLVIDADCRIDRASIAALVATAASEGKPAQAVYLLRPDLTAAPFVQMSNLAFMLRNLVRQRGMFRLAKRVHLTGTGMAFPWILFADADLGGGSIVEDLDLGLSLAARGHGPVLVEDATVWSPAASAQGTMQQRERWEGGFMKQGLPNGVRGMARSLANLDGRGLIASIALCIPPLALLGMLDVIALLVSGLAALAGASIIPFLGILTASAIAGLAGMLAWIREGRRFASLGVLVRLPIYALRKLPMYSRILIRGAPRNWLRTDRSE